MATFTCKTVKIKAGDDYAVINESDFDVEIHELFDAPATPTPKEGSVDWLKQEIAAMGQEVPAGAKKADLQAMYDALKAVK